MNKEEILDDAILLIEQIRSSFISIGGPLNDNKLKFNAEQLIYISELNEKMRCFINANYCSDCERLKVD